MKLFEIDWNKMASGGDFSHEQQPQTSRPNKPRDHKSATITFTIGIDPRADADEVQGEVEDLKWKIEEIIQGAMEDGTTLITGVNFSEG